MKQNKFRIIQRFNEDVLGYFARRSLGKWRKNRTSIYLKYVLKRDRRYRNLFRQRKYRRLFFRKRKIIMRLSGWYNRRKYRRWRFFTKKQLERRRKRRRDKRRLKRRLKREKMRKESGKKEIFRIPMVTPPKIVGGLDFVYHLNIANFFGEGINDNKNKVIRKEKKMLKRRPRRSGLKRDILFLRQKLRKFYEFKSFKNFKFLLYSKLHYKKNLGLSYIYLLEGRLEVVLYRANFFVSILAARQAITHFKVLVNGFIVNKPNYLLNVGDIVTLNKIGKDRFYFYKKYLRWRTFRKYKNILLNYPKYLEVNYKLLSVMFIKIPQIQEVPFPFLLDLELMQYRFK